jgi:hypothetical protein
MGSRTDCRLSAGLQIGHIAAGRAETRDGRKALLAVRPPIFHNHQRFTNKQPETMSSNSSRWSLGLMSGNSLYGIDAALIRSDGRQAVETRTFLAVPYESAFRGRLRGVLGGRGPSAHLMRA